MHEHFLTVHRHQEKCEMMVCTKTKMKKSDPLYAETKKRFDLLFTEAQQRYALRSLNVNVISTTTHSLEPSSRPSLQEYFARSTPKSKERSISEELPARSLPFVQFTPSILDMSADESKRNEALDAFGFRPVFSGSVKSKLFADEVAFVSCENANCEKVVMRRRNSLPLPSPSNHFQPNGMQSRVQRRNSLFAVPLRALRRSSLSSAPPSTQRRNSVSSTTSSNTADSLAAPSKAQRRISLSGVSSRTHRRSSLSSVSSPNNAGPEVVSSRVQRRSSLSVVPSRAQPKKSRRSSGSAAVSKKSLPMSLIVSKTQRRNSLSSVPPSSIAQESMATTRAQRRTSLASSA